MLVKRFRLAEHGTTVRTEVLGGMTTFATMAYIIVVNPAILSFAGFPTGPATVATILVAGLGTLAMGLYANRPIGVAPYMGENAFVAFSLTAMGIAWPQMLGAVFVSGLAFVVMTLVGVRSWLAAAISPSLKYGFAAGIGLFLALIGLYQTGIVTSAVVGLPAEGLTRPDGLLGAPSVPLKIGDLGDPVVRLAILGFVVTVVLLHRRVRGAILMGMILTAGLGLVLGHGQAPKAMVSVPFTGQWTLGPLLLGLDVPGSLRLSLLPVLLTLFLMGFLDTLGSLVGVGAAGGMLDEKGEFPEIEKPMLVDAVSCVAAGLVGTTTSGAYIESATGIREGARTGLAAVVTGTLFLLSLVFLPLFEPLQKLSYAYSPALVAVGLFMVGSVRHIDFEDLTELVPVFVTIAMMVFTYNIANGLTAGLTLYPVIKAAAGRGGEVKPGTWALGAVCASYYFFGLPH